MKIKHLLWNKMASNKEILRDLMEDARKKPILQIANKTLQAYSSTIT
jgi:hypothetical protein